MPGVAPLAKSSRLQFIDLLRGWSVFVMIETHTVNAVLRPEIKDEAPFKVLTFINGLVAPSFLFCAGLALAITLHRKWGDYTGMKSPFWRYILRVLFILTVGYSLHLPFFSLKRIQEITDPRVWIPFFQTDILQTIAVTLFIMVCLAVVVRKESLYLPVAVVLLLLNVFAAPIIRAMDLHMLPLWLQPYLTMQVKTQFPLFPWSGFLMAGVVTAWYYRARREEGKEKEGMAKLFLIALIMIGASILAELVPLTLYPNHDFWKASPEFFFARLGLVLLGLAGCWKYEQVRLIKPNSFLTLFGKESLLVYVVHLLIVYGYTYEWSFARRYGPTLNYLQALGLFVMLTLGMALMAYIWHRTKEWNLRYAKIIQAAILTGIVITFLLKTT